jgi:hypothetical protein
MAVRVAREHPVAPSARPMVPVLWLIVPALLASLVLGGFWFYGWYHSRSSSTTAPVALGGLAWGDSVIYNRREMRVWLGQHGASYHRWKRRHPAAYRIITHKSHAQQPQK